MIEASGVIGCITTARAKMARAEQTDLTYAGVYNDYAFYRDVYVTFPRPDAVEVER